jgi:dTDP-4-amino-4,6-dideoxygalactose transaminase
MKMFYTDDKMPNAERFSQEVLSLPIYPFLEDYEVSYVCKCIGDFYGV